MEQEKRVKLRIKESKKKTEEEKKAAKASDFEKLKQDILAQSHREPIRNCPSFNFVEPAPGCHYDIGNSHGYVLVPIPAKENFMEFGDVGVGAHKYGDILHEYIYISHY